MSLIKKCKYCKMSWIKITQNYCHKCKDFIDYFKELNYEFDRDYLTRHYKDNNFLFEKIRKIDKIISRLEFRMVACDMAYQSLNDIEKEIRKECRKVYDEIYEIKEKLKCRANELKNLIDL